MGPSGSGKTTLLNILGSIDTPTSGTLNVNGQDVSALNRSDLALHRRQHIGFIFQDYNLLDAMTLEENIVLPLVLSGRGKQYAAERAAQFANDLGILPVLDKYPYQVSGGEQQRASLLPRTDYGTEYYFGG
jgi:putative ABC transport system ATP-binding protein